MSEDETDAAKPPDRFVLDSFALLAYLQDESGADDVRAVLQWAAERRAEVWMPVVNLGEALYIIEREQSLQAAQKALAAVDQLPIELAIADRGLTLAAAHVKAQRSVSYADAFVVALAREHEATVLTGDPELRRVEDLVTVQWLPQD